VATKKKKVIIGGLLYTDALGAKDTPEGTYIGMVKYNVNTITKALK
jgi:manganese/zinc/iron transport system substrate-binding protein